MITSSGDKNTLPSSLPERLFQFSGSPLSYWLCACIKMWNFYLVAEWGRAWGAGAGYRRCSSTLQQHLCGERSIFWLQRWVWVSKAPILQCGHNTAHLWWSWKNQGWSYYPFGSWKRWGFCGSGWFWWCWPAEDRKWWDFYVNFFHGIPL